MFAVNVRAMLLTIQVAAPPMIASGGGKIVNIASMGGKVAVAGQAHYAASKAAVISLTQAAAWELGSHGINVNCVCPGYVLTEMGADTRWRSPPRGGWSSRRDAWFGS
jgi:3-oxoacyl-[acyl-carrier protein] reductase